MKKNKIVLISLMLILMLALTGCGKKVFTDDHLIECKEGKYTLEKEDLNNLKDLKVELDFIKVQNQGNFCVATMVLKKPVIIMGTEVYSQEFKSYDLSCKESMLKHNMLDKIHFCMVS